MRPSMRLNTRLRRVENPHIESSKVLLLGGASNLDIVQILQLVFPTMIGCNIFCRDDLDVELPDAFGILLPQFPAIGILSWPL